MNVRAIGTKSVHTILATTYCHSDTIRKFQMLIPILHVQCVIRLEFIRLTFCFHKRTKTKKIMINNEFHLPHLFRYSHIIVLLFDAYKT